MDLNTFALEAKAAGAVVLIAVQGGLAQSGALQGYFEFHKVPFTGAPARLACQLMCDPGFRRKSIRVLRWCIPEVASGWKAEPVCGFQWCVGSIG